MIDLPVRNLALPVYAKCVMCFLLASCLGACGSLRVFNSAEEGATAEAWTVWDRWVDSDGDIAVATTWEKKVRDGVTTEEIDQTFDSIAAEYNIKKVGESDLSAELEARTGQKQKFLKVYSFCSPVTARAMVDFSPAMAAYLPCRLAVVEKEDGLWIYAMNMDMLIKMGRKMPPELKGMVLQVRNAIREMMERGALGEF